MRKNKAATAKKQHRAEGSDSRPEWDVVETTTAKSGIETKGRTYIEPEERGKDTAGKGVQRDSHSETVGILLNTRFRGRRRLYGERDRGLASGQVIERGM